MAEKKRQFREIRPHTLGNARHLRSEMTPAEYKLWGILRNRNLLGYKFRRQHPIDRYVVDFYCADAKLVVEIDGDVHALAENQKRDQGRSDQLEALGYQVVRFTNEDVLNNLEGVADRLLEVLES